MVPILLLFAAPVLAQSPESIRPAGSMRLLSVVHHPRALSRAHDVDLQGNLAFVAGKGGSVAVIDVADPARPKLLSYLSDPSVLDDGEAVMPVGTTLFVGARDFLSVDVTNPREPHILERVRDRRRFDKINDMVRVGRFVLTANKSGSVAVFDTADPGSPRLCDVLDTRMHGGLGAPHGPAVSGAHLVVVNTGREEPVHIRLYRAWDPAGNLLPASEWKQEGYAPSPDDLRRDWVLQGANRIASWGRFAAVGAFVPDRVGLFELPGDGRLTRSGTCPFATSTPRE